MPIVILIIHGEVQSASATGGAGEAGQACGGGGMGAGGGIFVDWPQLDLLYVYENQMKGKEYASGFQLTGCGFTVDGLKPKGSFFNVGAEIAVDSCDEHLFFSLRYEGKFGSNYSNNAGIVSIGTSF